MTMSGMVYICSEGETFDSAAFAIYRNEKYACELLAANPLLSSVPVFAGGERLRIPIMYESGEDGGAGRAPWKE